ncbi:hypothetical protein M427DRAFT_39768 [Gonapodya prolifera JEL478]|uniref:SH3 domain-containing protein n=1 Tax=Gonapodya prolifera (strain JEL478) TaxID=1344416 RepID=A0A138ZXT1_GONPJ|nr:hypothetical protein M427DRAFT_39768 [Gonapodya prolifera JEL478]|eukprot:KXS08953.1 hypothetical protein M427DRAFT_39768 [Gonapodya prolifera JEL478]
MDGQERFGGGGSVGTGTGRRRGQMGRRGTAVWAGVVLLLLVSVMVVGRVAGQAATTVGGCRCTTSCVGGVNQQTGQLDFYCFTGNDCASAMLTADGLLWDFCVPTNQVTSAAQSSTTLAARTSSASSARAVTTSSLVRTSMAAPIQPSSSSLPSPTAAPTTAQQPPAPAAAPTAAAPAVPTMDQMQAASPTTAAGSSGSTSPNPSINGNSIAGATTPSGAPPAPDSTGTIVGIVIALLALAAVGGLVVVVAMKRKRDREDKENPFGPPQGGYAVSTRNWPAGGGGPPGRQSGRQSLNRPSRGPGGQDSGSYRGSDSSRRMPRSTGPPAPPPSFLMKNTPPLPGMEQVEGGGGGGGSRRMGGGLGPMPYQPWLMGIDPGEERQVDSYGIPLPTADVVQPGQDGGQAQAWQQQQAQGQQSARSSRSGTQTFEQMEQLQQARMSRYGIESGQVISQDMEQRQQARMSRYGIESQAPYPLVQSQSQPYSARSSARMTLNRPASSAARRSAAYVTDAPPVLPPLGGIDRTPGGPETTLSRSKDSGFSDGRRKSVAPVDTAFVDPSTRAQQTDVRGPPPPQTANVDVKGPPSARADRADRSQSKQGQTQDTVSRGRSLSRGRSQSQSTPQDFMSMDRPPRDSSRAAMVGERPGTGMGGERPQTLTRRIPPPLGDTAARKTHTVTSPYEPRRIGGLRLRPGMVVEVFKSVGDGFVEGRELTRGEEGVFPESCIEGYVGV